MGRYDSHKNPFSYVLNSWSHRQTTNSREREPKSMPCHVQKTEKDFLHIAFETKNSIFTPPVMKMPQSFSRFGREPTQQKDMGLAVPGDYYNGGVTGFSGGGTNFYPRGNLSSLTFQPMSNLKSPKRDYDQHHETGGPKGWKVRTMEKQQQQQQSSQGSQGGGSGGSGGGGASTASLAKARANARAMGVRHYFHPSVNAFAANGSGGNGSSGGSSDGQSQQQKDADEQEKSKTEFSFDKDGKCVMQSVDEDHYLRVDQKNKTVTSQSKEKNIHQVESEKKSLMAHKEHVHMRFEGNRIWCDKEGCWSSKPIQVRQDPHDK